MKQYFYIHETVLKTLKTEQLYSLLEICDSLVNTFYENYKHMVNLVTSEKSKNITFMSYHREAQEILVIKNKIIALIDEKENDNTD